MSFEIAIALWIIAFLFIMIGFARVEHADRRTRYRESTPPKLLDSFQSDDKQEAIVIPTNNE